MTSVLPAEPASLQWYQNGDAQDVATDSAFSANTSSDLQDPQPVEEQENEEIEHPTAGALVVHSASALLAKDEDQPQDQLELLLAELGRIETQQDKLRDAVKHNKQIVIHPRQEVLEETDSEYDTPKAPTPKKKIVVSGGLTGFGIAQDLLQIDFSPPEEAPEEFRAVAFFDEPKEIKPGLSGSFGLCDPASKEMHHYLERLEEQQKMVLELITGKKQQLLDQCSSKGGTSRSSKQGAKPRPSKSRLSKNTRFGETGEKAAVANALGLSTSDKMSSLGSKAGTLSQTTKGSLAAKLPMMGPLESGSRPTPPSRASAGKPRTAPQGRAVAQAQMRRAQVQKEDLELKEQEEIKSQFAEPLVGTTPSTQHLAGKKGAKERAAAVKAAREEAEAREIAATEEAAAPEVMERATETKPATQKRVPVKVHAGGAAGRVSTLRTWDDPSEPNTPVSPATPVVPVASKPGVLRGLKNMLKGKMKS